MQSLVFIKTPSQTAGKCSKSFGDNLDSWEAAESVKHKRHQGKGEEGGGGGGGGERVKKGEKEKGGE